MKYIAIIDGEETEHGTLDGAKKQIEVDARDYDVYSHEQIEAARIKHGKKEWFPSFNVIERREDYPCHYGKAYCDEFDCDRYNEEKCEGGECGSWDHPSDWDFIYSGFEWINKGD